MSILLFLEIKGKTRFFAGVGGQSRSAEGWTVSIRYETSL